MNSSKEPIVERMQAEIVANAELKLRRRLSDNERQFVLRHGSLLALEMIGDTVASGTPAELERYPSSK
jgi:hypothetical protein